MSKKDIFRKEALQKYLEEQEKMVQLKLPSLRLLFWAWLFLGLLLLVGVWVCFIQIPVYASGQAMLIQDKTSFSGCPDKGICVTAFFPTKTSLRLKAGQDLMLQVRERQWLHLTITALEQDRSDFAQLYERFGQWITELSNTDQNFIVAYSFIQPEKYPDFDWSSGKRDFAVRTKIGSRRIASFLPWIGGLFLSRNATESSIRP